MVTSVSVSSLSQQNAMSALTTLLKNLWALLIASVVVFFSVICVRVVKDDGRHSNKRIP